MEKIDISDKDMEEYGRALVHTNLYKKLYGCNTLSNRVDFLEKAFQDNSPEVKKWVDGVRWYAKKIQKEACDFSDKKKLSEDEKKLKETEDFLSHQSDVLPYQIYSVRDLALRILHAGKN